MAGQPPGAEPVAILYRGHAVPEALATGLKRYGWLPTLTYHDEPLGTATGQPIVLAEDDLGLLSEAVIRQAVTLASVGRRSMVVVAGTTALAGVARIVAEGAIAVSADQPYRRLLPAVHDALRAHPIHPGQQARLLADLRQRAAETARFRTLTAGERAVLAELVAGRSAAAIAERRTVGLATTRSQIAAVLRKLGVRSQQAAMALTYRSCTDPRITESIRQFYHP